MKMKDYERITFILGGMSRGGAERVVAILANHFAKKGKKVDILTLLNSNCSYHLEPNVNLISLYKENKPRILQIVDWIKGIRSYYNHYRPHRIVSFFAKINIIVLLALINHTEDILVSERNDPSRDGRGLIVRLLTNILYPKSKKVIFQTEWARTCFSKNVRKKSEIVQNPVVEITVNNIEKEKTIVNVGKLMEQKNQKLLINCFSKIAMDYPEYKLIIFGEGEKRDELEALIKNLGLEDRIELPGWVSEVHKHVASAEMFVLSSNYEGLSNALLEAMTLGVPVISTNCAGSNELINHKKNGLLFPIGDEVELEKSMRFLLENPGKAKEIGEQGRKDTKKYGVSKIIGKWEDVIGLNQDRNLK